jgi:ADP-heptose:LPS heptosyltransferase
MAFPLSEFYQRTKSARRIVVIDFGFLGDSVHLIPALSDIKRNYPQAELHTVSANVGAEVLKMAPCVDKAWGVSLSPPPSLGGSINFQKLLRKQKFDLAINFSGSDRTIFVTAFTGARWRVGQQGAREHFWAKWLILHWVPRQANDVIVSEQRRRMLATVGMSLQPPRFDLKIPDTARDWAHKNVPERAVHFALNASSPVKEWPIDHWVELAEKMLSESDVEIIATASSNSREQERLRMFSEKVATKRVTPIVKLTIPELAATLQRCLLQVGGDSGVNHLAFAVGTPTFSLLRDYPTLNDWKLTGEKHRQIVVPCQCIASGENRCQLSGSKCLGEISPERAFEVIRTLL